MVSTDPARERQDRAERLFREFLGSAAARSERGFEDLCERNGDLAGDLRCLHDEWLWRAPAERADAAHEVLAALRQRLGDTGEAPNLRDEGDEADPEPRGDAEAVGGRYQVQREIARGGMGVVLRVLDRNLNRVLALKKLAPRAPGSTGAPRDSLRFLDEAQITSQLHHPGIVPIHDVGLDGAGGLYYTMKLVRGENLHAVLEHCRAGDENWPQVRVLNVLLRVCEAMAFAHSKQVIHRDLKPANIMVGRFGEAYVMDWGVARVLGRADRRDLRFAANPGASATVPIASVRPDGGESDSPLVTMDGDVIGTPVYMSPEQAEGRIEDMGPHSDVYALGAIFYELLTGQMPYVPPKSRLSPRVVLAQVLNGPPRPIAELAPRAPAELVAIAEKAMARDVAHRYRDMTDVADDLRRFLEGRVVRAYRSGPFAELATWMRRHRGTALAAAAVLAAMAGLLAFAASARSRAAAAAAVAQLRLDDVLRLSDLKVVAELDREVAELVPAWPDRVRQMEDWLARAAGLVGRLPEHERTLAMLQSEAPSTVTIGGDRRWWENSLAELVRKIEALGTFEPPSRLVQRMQARLERARTIEERSIGAYETEWTEAILSIADAAECPQYHGLDLTPQMGLAPVGRDKASGLWEFFAIDSGSAPARRDDGTLAVAEDGAIVLVLIPGGSAWLGAQQEDPAGINYDPDAAFHLREPFHVDVEPFFLSKYELTQSQYLTLTGKQPSENSIGSNWPLRDKRVTGRHPVEMVDYDECQAALQRLGMVIPTDVQWEYAARAGVSTPWTTGALLADLQRAANIADESCVSFRHPNYAYEHGYLDYWPLHAPVGSFEPNAFGLYDVIGNVREWCVFGDGTGRAEVHLLDPALAVSTTKGGSFDLVAFRGKLANNLIEPPNYSNRDLGVRPARAREE